MCPPAIRIIHGPSRLEDPPRTRFAEARTRTCRPAAPGDESLEKLFLVHTHTSASYRNPRGQDCKLRGMHIEDWDWDLRSMSGLPWYQSGVTRYIRFLRTKIVSCTIG